MAGGGHPRGQNLSTSLPGQEEDRLSLDLRRLPPVGHPALWGFLVSSEAPSLWVHQRRGQVSAGELDLALEASFSDDRQDRKVRRAAG